MKRTWRLTTPEKCEAVRRYRSGELLQAIADDLGVQTGNIRYHARQRGLPRRSVLSLLRRKHRHLSAGS